MQASATLESTPSAPPASLRFQLPKESVEQTKDLYTLPFVVGRSEHAHLQIVSNRVSREHAAFSWEDGRFWVSDLGSTNGTFFRGSRIERQAISDGDTVNIADIRVTLEVEEISPDEQGALVSKVRAWQEMLLRRGVLCGFLPVWDLVDSRMAACLAVGLKSSLCSAAIQGAPPSTRVARQARWMTLLRAVELAGELPKSTPLMIELQDRDDADHWLPVIAIQTHDRPVTVCLPSSAPSHHYLTRLIHDCDMKAAVVVEPDREFPGGVEQWWLSPQFTQGIAEDESLWQPLADVMEAAGKAHVTVVAQGLADEAAARICAEMDCRWGMGPMFGEPRAACELS